MIIPLPISVSHLSARREALGMSYSDLARRSGVSMPTVKRIFGGQLADASFSNVNSIIQALGLSFETDASDVDVFCRMQARRKAELVAQLVQGTSALEGQAVDSEAYARLVEKSYHELLAGSKRKLWSAQ